ncbi:hypothetical protein PPYR_00266 [Photinus pyralis]|uniref:Mutator-like transposase domain-containing protein n=1 Tax=Photinus pyralis TaxID=7054 RepID=A0A5N4B157_PHOPY|nr:hypothetical protein PPYR_00266 [Photinus pyralis]
MKLKINYQRLVARSLGWQLSLYEYAGKREKTNAVDCGNVCKDGTPWITVYDGSWSKRSYGTNFNALSGMVKLKEAMEAYVGIIGKHTGELLYIAIRN